MINKAVKAGMPQGMTPFNVLPEFVVSERSVENIEMVVLSDVNGHFDRSVTELIQFEREYQAFCCLTSSYYLSWIVISPSIPIPILDEEALRAKRAQFVSDFTRRRPYYLIRGKTPDIIFNELDKLIEIVGLKVEV